MQHNYTSIRKWNSAVALRGGTVRKVTVTKQYTYFGAFTQDGAIFGAYYVYSVARKNSRGNLDHAVRIAR